MNRKDRNAIREATDTINDMTERLKAVTAERDTLKKTNANLRRTLTRERNKRKDV